MISLNLLLFDQTVEVVHSKDKALASSNSHPHTSTACYCLGSVLTLSNTIALHVIGWGQCEPSAIQMYGKWDTLASHRWWLKYFNNSILGGLIYLHIQRLPTHKKSDRYMQLRFKISCVLIMEFRKCAFLWEYVDYKDKWTRTVRFSGAWIGHPFTVESEVLSTCAYQNISKD